MIQQSEECIQKHYAYKDKLSDLKQWIKVTTEMIELYQGAEGDQYTEGQVADFKVRKTSWCKMLIIHLAAFRH